jgi:hypothetical protein
VEVLEALRAVEVRWKARREVELATPRSMLLWVAFKAVFLNIAGFFRRIQGNNPKSFTVE